jgi:phage tail sheath gpL-like
MGSIVLTGIPADYALPGNYIEVNLGVGPVNGSSLDYPILLMGNKTTAGIATADTVVYGPTTATPLQTENDVISLFGTGSELHRMWLRVTDAKVGAGNQTTAVYAIAVAESAGVAATGTITYTGTATAATSTRVWVGSEFVDTTIANGDTPTVIAANVAANINTKTRWAVTATASVGAVTITCKNKGPRGNFIRYSAMVVSSTATTTVSPTAVTNMASGATADVNTTALSTVLPMRFYSIVSAAEDATQFGAVVAQVNSQALPATGIRQRCYAGYNGTQANAITISTGINAARAEYVHLANSDWVPYELAAHAAGVYALEEVKKAGGGSKRHNFSGYGNGPGDTPWKVPAPRDGSMPSATVLNTGIKNGLTPIGVNPNGTTFIAKRCTTRCLNGSNPDFRSRDAHKVTICDYFADDWYAKLALNYQGKDLADDPVQGAHVPGSQVVTPLEVRGGLIQLLVDYNNNDQLKNFATTVKNSVVQREASPTTRLSTRVPLECIDILDQTTTAVDNVG